MLVAKGDISLFGLWERFRGWTFTVRMFWIYGSLELGSGACSLVRMVVVSYMLLIARDVLENAVSFTMW